MLFLNTIWSKCFCKFDVWTGTERRWKLKGQKKMFALHLFSTSTSLVEFAVISVQPCWNMTAIFLQRHFLIKLNGPRLITPSTQCYLMRFWYAFSMLKLTKFWPPFGGGSTFYYTSHVMQRFILHICRARPLNGFENGSNSAENRIDHLLLTFWDGNSTIFSANQARAD